MVLHARWILENNPNAGVAIITGRDELDKQVERVVTEAGEAISRTSSGRDLLGQVGQANPRLLCSLVPKFGRKDVDDFGAFIKELEGRPSPTAGEVFVFVDECHRTQSGKLHRVMKAIMPNAVFIGFTGTPLLKKDRATSLEGFGGYIHTYKFSEAVEDAVVLGLVYEAREIDRRLGSDATVDAWCEARGHKGTVDRTRVPRQHPDEDATRAAALLRLRRAPDIDPNRLHRHRRFPLWHCVAARFGGGASLRASTVSGVGQNRTPTPLARVAS
jgi:hypothetical protein